MENSKLTAPLFSLCHSTAREPDGWRAAHKAWVDACDDPSRVEYILVTDTPLAWKIDPKIKWFQNEGRKCPVDGWNRAAWHSSGKFLITVADDWRPCPHWDTEIKKRIPNMDAQYVLDVNTGGDRPLLTFSMLTRAYYHRYGYIFYPHYIGMMADNDFTDVAHRDGVVIDAQDLFFEHLHPDYGKAPRDRIYERQHRDEAWRVGREVYARRKACNFAQ